MARLRTFALIVALFVALPWSGRAEPGPADDSAEIAADESSEADAPDAEPEDPDYDDDDDGGLGDIESLVVTARRRPEFLQETPVAATVLGGELLEQRGVDSLEDIAVYVPNLSAFSGVQHQGTFYSRGVGQRDAIVTLDPGVGIYVDDVYIARGQGALLPTVDLERIEVLRGPQGTLYGKNTIGGAVKLVSQKPGPEPYIAGSLGGGTYDAINGSATVNAPLLDNLLYSRFTFVGRNREGYNTNFAIDDHHYNDENLTGVRGQLRLLPSDYVTVDLAGHFSHQREDARGAKCRVSDPVLAGNLSFVFPTFASGCSTAENASTYKFSTDLTDHYFLDAYGTSLVAAWEGGERFGFLDSLDLKSVSSWQEQNVVDGFLDLDANANPFLYQRTLDDLRQTQYSQEIQAVAAALDDRLRLTTGVYGFWEDTGGGDVLSNNFGDIRRERTEIANNSYAIYGQVSGTPVEWLELTGGLRETWEKKSAERILPDNFDFTPPAAGPEQADEHVHDSFSQFTPMAGISLKAPGEMIEDTPIGSGIFYYTYSQGYKSGGFSTRRDPSVSSIPSFDSEEIENHELGLKLEMFDHRVLFNTALFYSKYEDIQLTVARVNPNSLPFRPDIGSSIANAGKAHIKGVELELITRPWRELVVRGSLGLTDAKYDKFEDLGFTIDGGTGVITTHTENRQDEDFYNIPDLSVDGSVEYPLAFSSLGLPDYGTLTPLVHVYYQTDTDTHFTAAGFASHKFRQDAYTLMDLRLMWDLWDDRTQVTFFVNNLLDTDYFESSVDLTNTLGIGGVYYAAPRMIGGEVRYRWY
jgi:iron complex outermembrane receptor protein